jgi:hypothetical protein
MAGFETWDRQLLPQGGLIAPQTGPSLAESFGEGLTDLATAAGKAVESMRATDEWREEKEWEIKLPEAAALVNTLQLDHLGRSPELKAAAATGLSDYPEKIDLDIRSATGKALKDITDPRYLEYVHARMDAFRVSAVAAGIQDKTVATLERDAGALQTLMDGQAKLVADDFTKYDAAVSLIDETIAANRHFGADRKAEFSKIGKYALAKVGLDALINHDLDAADKVLASGKLDGVLTADDEQFYRETIKSERELRAREALLIQQREAETLQADGAVAKERAFRAARETGRYDPADRALIIKAYPNDYPEILAKLEVERTKGHDTFIIPQQTAAEDEALLRDIAGQLRENPHDNLLSARLGNIKAQLHRKKETLRLNPEALVRETVPEVQKGWEEVKRNPADLDLLRKTKELSRQAQLARGVAAEEVRVLPEFMGEYYLKIVDGPGGGAAIAQIRNALGDDYRELKDQASRMAKPLSSVALSLEQPQQLPVQERLLEIERDGGVTALEALPRKYALSSAAAYVERQLADFAPSFAEQGRGGEQAFRRMKTAVYALTLDYADLSGDVEEAAERAAREIVTGFYRTAKSNGHTIRIPFGYDASMIEEVLPQYTANQIDYSMVEKPKNRPEMTPEQVKSTVLSKCYWTVNSDESGLYLRKPSGDPVKIDGEPIIVKWRDLIQLWRQSEPDTPPVY